MVAVRSASTAPSIRAVSVNPLVSVERRSCEWPFSRARAGDDLLAARARPNRSGCLVARREEVAAPGAFPRIFERCRVWAEPTGSSASCHYGHDGVGVGRSWRGAGVARRERRRCGPGGGHSSPSHGPLDAGGARPTPASGSSWVRRGAARARDRCCRSGNVVVPTRHDDRDGASLAVVDPQRHGSGPGRGLVAALPRCGVRLRAAAWRGVARFVARSWQPGDVIGHNDAAPYNAVWDIKHDRLVGFVDWDFAGPCPSVRDLAFVALSWVPLHARDVTAAGGFYALRGAATSAAAAARHLRLRRRHRRAAGRGPRAHH